MPGPNRNQNVADMRQDSHSEIHSSLDHALYHAMCIQTSLEEDGVTGAASDWQKLHEDLQALAARAQKLAK